MAFIELTDVRITFGKGTGRTVQAVENVSLCIEKGEFLAVVGPSGCGKSSLLSAIAGLIDYTGSITVDGKATEPGSRQFGYMFQEGSLLPWRTAERNAQIGLEIRGVEPRAARLRVDELMERVGL